MLNACLLHVPYHCQYDLKKSSRRGYLKQHSSLAEAVLVLGLRHNGVGLVAEKKAGAFGAHGPQIYVCAVLEINHSLLAIFIIQAGRAPVFEEVVKTAAV